MVVLSFLHYDNALYPHIIHNISDIVVFKSSTTQLTFTCSKSAIETLEKDLKYVKKKQKKHQNDVDVVLLVLLLTKNMFQNTFWCFYSLLWTTKC